MMIFDISPTWLFFLLIFSLDKKRIKEEEFSFG